MNARFEYILYTSNSLQFNIYLLPVSSHLFIYIEKHSSKYNWKHDCTLAHISVWCDATSLGEIFNQQRDLINVSYPNVNDVSTSHQPPLPTMSNPTSFTLYISQHPLNSHLLSLTPLPCSINCFSLFPMPLYLSFSPSSQTYFPMLHAPLLYSLHLTLNLLRLMYDL